MKKRFVSLFIAMLTLICAAALTSSVYAAESNSAASYSVGANDYIIKYNSQMAVGTKQQIQVVINGDIDAPDPSFSSSNTSVATVNSKGVVSAKNAGTVNITYSPDGNSSKSISVTVKDLPKSISISATSKTLNVGQKFSLNASVSSSAYDSNIQYSSSNSGIASVSSSGVVNARSEGKAVITASTVNGVKASCTVYVYSNSGISLNKTAQKIAMDYDNVTKIVYGTSVMGRDLEAYVINGNGNNSKTIFCTFAVHGFEDNYAHDGKVLVECANDLIAYIAQNPSVLNDYRMVIVPCGNPDGTIDGKNNLRSGSSAFGRCTASHVDMNRDFISGSFKGQESRALRDLMKQYKMNIYIDFHGWLNSVLGNGTLVDIFRSTNGISRDQTGSYGTSQGYIFGWANANLGARTALVEFKSPSNCNYLNVVKGIQRATSGSYHPSSMVVEYSSSIPAVKNVASTSVSANSVSLKWDSVSGAKGYQVEYSTDGGVNWVQNEVFGTTSITVNNLSPSTVYKFKVRAFTYSGNVRTYSTTYSGWITVTTIPNAVTGFKASGRSSDGSSIILDWDKQLNADGYNIYWSKDGKWVKLATLEGSMTANYRVPTYADSKYYFAIEAYKGSSSNVGARTTYNTYSSAPAPDNFSVNAVSSNKISATWSGKSGVGYYIEWATDSAFTKNCESKYISAGSSSTQLTTSQNSTNYYVRIRSCREFGSEEIFGGFSNTLSTSDSLFVPYNFNVYARGDGGTDLYLDWNGVSGADGYRVYIVSGSKEYLKGSVTDSKFTFTDLTPSWSYTVMVVAFNESKAVSAKTTVCAGPAAVENVSARATGNVINVKWNAQSGSGYAVEWSMDKTFEKVAGTKQINGSSNTSCSINVSEPQNYYVRVRALKTFEGSDIYGDFSDPVKSIIVPGEPGGYNVIAYANGGKSLTLDWNGMANVDGYRVYIVSGSKEYLKGNTKDSKFKFNDLTPGWSYTVMVVAYNENGSTSSKTTVCAAPSTVDNVSAKASGSTIYASWSSVSGSGYVVEWSADKDFNTVTGSKNINGSGTTSCSVNISNPQNYYVRVRAWKNFSGSKIYGNFSDSVEAVLVPGTPGGYSVIAYADGGKSLTLDWNGMANVDGYRVYIVSGSKEYLKGDTKDSKFKFTDLTPGWSYTVMVVAYNENGSTSSKTTVRAAS